MRNDLIQRLPTRAEVGLEIVATSRLARRLRALYRLIQKVESDRGNGRHRLLACYEHNKEPRFKSIANQDVWSYVSDQNIAHRH